MTKKVILYGSPICHMVPPVRHLLGRAKVEFEYIDIYRSAEGREAVQAINHGNQSVPTIIFLDDSTLTEPSLSDLRAKLEALGYPVPELSWSDKIMFLFDNPLTRIIGVVLFMVGLNEGMYIVMTIGVLILLSGWLYKLGSRLVQFLELNQSN